jgi:hypothetical protein
LGRLFRQSKLILAFLLIMTAIEGYSSQQIEGFPLNEQTHLVADSLGLDSLQVDSISINVPLPDSISNEPVELPSSALINASIYYDAQDSIVFDAIEDRVLLYGTAIVRYEKMQLTADYIEYSFKENLACASGLADSSGVVQGKPIFKEGTQEFTQESLCFNFRTKEGYSFEVVTHDGDAYLHSKISKRHNNEWIHIKDGKFTTCDAENPHYHFHLTKAIVVPEKKIVTGPVYMKVRKVPLPLALPFGFFPNKQERSHGIILPGYGEAASLGFFLKGGGYYIPLGDRFDTKVLFDIYSRGSWSMRNVTGYKVRYKYSGNLDISRTITKSGFAELPSFSKRSDFFVRWNHNQDIKARPNTRFSASINAGTSTNFENNLSSNQTDLVSNTFSSSVNWNKNWGSRYNLTLAGRHTQNTLTGNVSITLPSVSFAVSRFEPFSILNRSASARKKWYERVGLTYSANFENSLASTDKELRWDETPNLLANMKNGIKQNATMSTSFKAVNGFITINPRVSANSYTTFKILEVALDPDDLQQVRDTVFGMRNAFDWSASVSASTKIYGLYRFKRVKNIQAVRHVMTPSVGLSYDPYRDYSIYGYFGDGGVYSSYSEFDLAHYRPRSGSEAGSVNFTLANNLEMKVRDKKATKEAWKKVKLIDGFTISSSYNLVADSLNLSPINLRAFTSLGNNLNVTINSRLNAYDRDTTGQTINTFLWDSQSKLARMEALTFSLNTRLNSKIFSGDKSKDNLTEEEENLINQNPGLFVDFSVPWSLNLTYNLGLKKQFQQASQRDSTLISQTVMFNGDVSIFKYWKIGFQSGYDFAAWDWTVTTLNLYWDLHCWEMSFNWVPIGPLKSYSVQLNVKSAMLKDLKLQRRGNLGQRDVLY